MGGAPAPGNLLVMRDGRIGFIDFGIVGSISPATWQALQALLDSTSTADYATMAKAMATLGVTRQAVDTQVQTVSMLPRRRLSDYRCVVVWCAMEGIFALWKLRSCAELPSGQQLHATFMSCLHPSDEHTPLCIKTPCRFVFVALGRAFMAACEMECVWCRR